jgi:3-mercaptopropionate dioxygenase
VASRDQLVESRRQDIAKDLAQAPERRQGRAGLGELIVAVRAAVQRHADWPGTARAVAAELERWLPSPDVLAPDERDGHPGGHRSYVLHSEPDGTFSIVALVWRPDQETPIHDHVTWCVFGVIQGVEYEELFMLDEANGYLVQTGSSVSRAGDVSGFAPPGDIHRVRNVGDRVAISIHVYGTDVGRIGSSVRRHYELPVHAAS